MTDDPSRRNPDLPSHRERLVEWDAALDNSSYYEILGVEELADERAIRASYHRFALAFHPDCHVGADAESLASALRIFQRGTEAYRVLTHPDLRLRYDMALARGRRRLLSSELPPTTASDDAGRPLHELCRSAGAKLSAQRATRFIDAGDPKAAKRELLLALEHDGGANSAIQERIDALDVVLYAMGETEL
jgi:curved DNA-binding protein CbpA